MTWNHGGVVLAELIDVVQNTVKDDHVRAQIYDKMLEVFTDAECDNIGDCLGLDSIFDQCYLDYFPSDGIDDFYDEDFDEI